MSTTAATTFHALVMGEFALTDEDELLYRQITDHHWDVGADSLSSTAFGPAPIDAGKSSHSRSAKVSAQEARDWHNANAKSPSRGVWACSVGEVNEETRAVDDTGVTSQPDQASVSPGHAYVDYQHMTKRAQREVRSQLLMYALERKEIATQDSA